MSTCISSAGEFGSHILDNLHTCTRCHVLDEDAMRADLEQLRGELNVLKNSESLDTVALAAVRAELAQTATERDELREFSRRMSGQLEEVTGKLGDGLFRVGRHQSRNLYRGDEYIGVMFTESAAAMVVAALNDDYPLADVLTASVDLDTAGPEPTPDGPGQTETDEAHGWTGHGHPCCRRARLAGRPTSIARCGGPGMCDKCSESSARIHNGGG